MIYSVSHFGYTFLLNNKQNSKLIKVYEVYLNSQKHDHDVLRQKKYFSSHEIQIYHY